MIARYRDPSTNKLVEYEVCSAMRTERKHCKAAATHFCVRCKQKVCYFHIYRYPISAHPICVKCVHALVNTWLVSEEGGQ